MHKFLMILAAVLMLASCAKKYKIEGSSAISELDGKKISVKVIKDDSLATVATGTMAHGKFTVKGQIDSATMANLFIGEDIVIPIVLEEGEISVDLKAEDLVWGGTELNETLYKFFKSRDSLQTQLRDIQKMEYEMTVNGVDEQTINQRLMAEMQKVSAKEDVLTTSFIKSHYNDALGVGVFVMLLSNMQYPVMTPQIEDILTTAPDAFKQHKLVKKYQEDAKQFSEQQNIAK